MTLAWILVWGGAGEQGRSSLMKSRRKHGQSTTPLTTTLFLLLATYFATNSFTAVLYGRYFRKMMSQGQQDLATFRFYVLALHPQQNLVTNQRYRGPQIAHMKAPVTKSMLCLSEAFLLFGNNRREASHPLIRPRWCCRLLHLKHAMCWGHLSPGLCAQIDLISSMLCKAMRFDRMR